MVLKSNTLLVRLFNRQNATSSRNRMQIKRNQMMKKRRRLTMLWWLIRVSSRMKSLLTNSLWSFLSWQARKTSILSLKMYMIPRLKSFCNLSFNSRKSVFLITYRIFRQRALTSAKLSMRWLSRLIIRRIRTRMSSVGSKTSKSALSSLNK